MFYELSNSDDFCYNYLSEIKWSGTATFARCMATRTAAKDEVHVQDAAPDVNMMRVLFPESCLTNASSLYCLRFILYSRYARRKKHVIP